MKLQYRIISRLSFLLVIIMSIWAVLFYFAIMDEINDEVDDSLEDYSEMIIIQALAGKDLPTKDHGSNNQYFITEITEEYAKETSKILYEDSMIYIPEKKETEPARILSTIFKDEENKYYQLTVSTPTIEKKDLKEAILYWVIFLYVSLLIIIILVNIWVYYRSTRPLYTLLSWLDNYKVGKKNSPLINNTDITEFKKLNAAAVDIMNRAEQAFEKQKEFIGNASHEIQTPLAVCQNRLEMLMEDETLTEKQLGDIIKAHQNLEYITRLNKSLLLLSKIDNKQFTDNKTVEINDVVKEHLDNYKEIYGYKNISLDLKENGIFKININEALATILINNMLKNSYVHNIENGRILIEINNTDITFKNTGEEKALNERLIFDRFYQGSKKEGSTGLGLAISKSICDLEKLKLSYFFENNQHCFKISF